MRDGMPSRWVSGRNSPHGLSAREHQRTPYGPAIAIGLSIAAWTMIIGTAVLFL
jgi:hypothetical protein